MKPWVHNCLVHPLMTLAEIFGNTRMAKTIWDWHEATKSVLPGYEVFHSDNHVQKDGKLSNVIHNCLWHPLLPVAEVLRNASLTIWRGHEESLENMPKFEKYFEDTHKEQA